MSRQPDAHRALCRSVLAQLDCQAAAIRQSTSHPWCSVTFTGARHHVAIALGDGGAVARARALLAHARSIEFSLPGHIVADVSARLDMQTAPDTPTLLHIEALTVEAA